MRNLALLLPIVATTILGCVPPSGEESGRTIPDGGEELAACLTIDKSGLWVRFDSSCTTPGGYNLDEILVRWDYTNDGTFDTDWTFVKISNWQYPGDGTYTARLEVQDPRGQTDSATKLFTITAVNHPPVAAVNVVVKGMTVSLDASSSYDAEDSPEDLRMRIDWGGDDIYNTGWIPIDTPLEHTYVLPGEYTIQVQVRDLNGAVDTWSQKIIASYVTIRNAYTTFSPPYTVKMHFRLINERTGQPVTWYDMPPLTRGYFSMYEDRLPIDVSETTYELKQDRFRPTRMVLVLDFTGSMYDSGGVEPMVDAATLFIESLRQNTYLSLWAFYERQGGREEIIPFTHCDPEGKGQLVSRLHQFAAGGRVRGATEIWDTLAQIISTKYPDSDTGENRIVLFLSDGHDTSSTSSPATIASAARKKGISIFSLGLAFRPLEYPADEPGLKKVAEDSGGLYFTVNQVEELATIFGQLSEDVTADWVLYYITLRNCGTHTAEAFCNYLDGYGKMAGKFTISPCAGGDRTPASKGLLGVVPSLDDPPVFNEYTLYAYYLPRDIRELKVRITSAAPVWLTLYSENTLCDPAQGWRIVPDVAAGENVPADGWYTISSSTPFEYGAWGRIAKCTVQTSDQIVRAELSALIGGDRTIVFSDTDDACLQYSFSGTDPKCTTQPVP